MYSGICMSVKAIVDTYRSLPGYAGMAVYRQSETLYSEGTAMEKAIPLIRLLTMIPGASKVRAVAGSFTITTFVADDLFVAVRTSGRFSTLPPPPCPEPEFVDGTVMPDLPSIEVARRQAEAALRSFRLIE
jgi:hypothetical protein